MNVLWLDFLAFFHVRHTMRCSFRSLCFLWKKTKHESNNNAKEKNIPSGIPGAWCVCNDPRICLPMPSLRRHSSSMVLTVVIAIVIYMRVIASIGQNARKSWKTSTHSLECLLYRYRKRAARQRPSNSTKQRQKESREKYICKIRHSALKHWWHSYEMLMLVNVCAMGSRICVFKMESKWQRKEEVFFLSFKRRSTGQKFKEFRVPTQKKNCQHRLCVVYVQWPETKFCWASSFAHSLI